MKPGVKKLLIMLIILTLLLAAGWGIKQKFFTKEPVAYITAPVTALDLEEKVLASATLTPFKTVAVGAQVSGQLKKLHVALGDQVKKGQVLAEIDPVLQQNTLREAEASLEDAQAQKRSKQALLRQYELALKRQQQMAARDAAAKADLESAEAQLDVTRAELAALEAQIKRARITVETAQANLGYTRIVAPMDGVVVAIVTEEGQTIVSAQAAPTILKLATVNTMTVKAQISEADVIRVKPGLTCYFSILGDPDKRYYGKLRAVEPGPDTYNDTTTNSSSTTAIYYNGLFEVPNPDNRLRVSMTAQVSIVLGQARQALTIPVSALGAKQQDGRYQVQVLQGEQTVNRVIRTGVTDHVNIQVLEGLKAGEKVIVGDSSSVPESQNSRHHGPPPGAM